MNRFEREKQFKNQSIIIENSKSKSYYKRVDFWVAIITGVISISLAIQANKLAQHATEIAIELDKKNKQIDTLTIISFKLSKQLSQLQTSNDRLSSLLVNSEKTTQSVLARDQVQSRIDANHLLSTINRLFDLVVHNENDVYENMGTMELEDMLSTAQTLFREEFHNSHIISNDTLLKYWDIAYRSLNYCRFELAKQYTSVTVDSGAKPIDVEAYTKVSRLEALNYAFFNCSKALRVSREYLATKYLNIYHVNMPKHNFDKYPL